MGNDYPVESEIILIDMDISTATISQEITNLAHFD